MPKYMRVGNRMRVGKGLRVTHYLGPMIASRDALFLHLFRGELGLCLSPIDLLADAVLKGQGFAMEAELGKLPTEVTRHPDWPIKGEKGRMIVVPKDAVKAIKYSIWTTFDLETDEHVFRVELRWIKRKRVLRFLRDSGWNW